jgi:O-Antigen ligase
MGASGSRGGLVGGVAGLLVVVWASAPNLRRAVLGAAAVVVVFGASLAITPLMGHVPGTHLYQGQAAAAPAPALLSAPASPVTKTITTTTVVTPAVPTPAEVREQRRVAIVNADDPLRMDSEIGRPETLAPTPPHRNLLSSSGRVTAWVGAIEQADQRPLLGYGFGTEDHVFVDRFFFFDGSRPENSWVGSYLMLGIGGVLALAVLLGWIALQAYRLLRGLPPAQRVRVAAVTGVFVGGLVEMLVQSFVTSAGDIAMLSFWVCAALLVTAPDWEKA